MCYVAEEGIPITRAAVLRTGGGVYSPASRGVPYHATAQPSSSIAHLALKQVVFGGRSIGQKDLSHDARKTGLHHVFCEGWYKLLGLAKEGSLVEVLVDFTNLRMGKEG